MSVYIIQKGLRGPIKIGVAARPMAAGTINNDDEFRAYRTRVLKMTKRGRPKKSKP